MPKILGSMHMRNFRLARRHSTCVLAAFLIGMLILPYASGATCDCHDHLENAEHCPTSGGPTLTPVNLEHRCDAMMACCRIDFGQVLQANATVSEWSFRDSGDVAVPDTISAALRAPPKPPPRA